MADKVGDEFERLHHGRERRSACSSSSIEHFVEGMVHVSTMADDYYRFVEASHTLRGENTRKVYRLGDRVRVQVVARGHASSAASISGSSEILDARARGRTRPRAAPKQGGAEARGAQARAPASASVGPSGAVRGDPGSCGEGTSMKSMVVGTAGHIDHGKSALVRALTGTDPDRLKEEQERGITIDLGFAHWQTGEVERRLRRRAGTRAVRAQHARRGRRHRRGRARRGRRRVGHAADPRALRDLPAAARAHRPDRVDQVRPGGRRHGGTRAARGARPGGRIVPGRAPVLPCLARRETGCRRCARRSWLWPSRRRGRRQGPARLPIDRVVHRPRVRNGRHRTLTCPERWPRARSWPFCRRRMVKVRGIQVHGRSEARTGAGHRVALNLGGVEVADLLARRDALDARRTSVTRTRRRAARPGAGREAAPARHARARPSGHGGGARTRRGRRGSRRTAGEEWTAVAGGRARHRGAAGRRSLRPVTARK